MARYTFYLSGLCLLLCINVFVDAGNNTTPTTKSKPKSQHKKEIKSQDRDVINSFSSELQSTLERFLIGRCVEVNSSADSPAPQRRSLLNNYVSKEKDTTSTVTCERDEDYGVMTGQLAELALAAHYIAKSMKPNEGRLFTEAVASVLSNTAKKITESAAFLAKKREAKLLLKSKKMSKSQKKNFLAKQKAALAVKKKNSSRTMDSSEKRRPYASDLNTAKISP